MSAIWVLSAVSLTLVLSVGFIIARVREARPYATGLGLLGLLFGAMLGLSASPVVASVLTGALSLAGIVVPACLSAERSTRFVPVIWGVGAFAAFALIGVLGGVVIRTNDLLNLQARSWATQWSELGFTKDQIALLMDQYVAKDDKGRSPSSGEPFSSVTGSSSLLSDESTWDRFRKQYGSDSELLTNVAIAYPRWGIRIPKLRECGMTDREIVEWVRMDFGK